MSDDREQKPTISACMIVKNEEKVLSRCLASICESVDEIIIVDTGSTDDSLNIARSFGAKVYCHPWEKDFARHRNQSIGYASGDWILIIDADEELISSTFETLHKAILAPDSVDGIYVCVENASPSGVLQSNSIRIIRNKCGIHYVGRVHNYLAGVTKTMFSDLRFFHHGYNLGRESDEQKFKRTTELLKLDVAEDPYNPRAHHFQIGRAHV